MFASRCLLGFCLALLGTGSAWPAERPNILFIVGDDVGWGDIRSNNPNGQVPLPALERLASEGINFTDAHSSAAKCAPSRYSLITGNYQWRGRLSWGTWEYKGGSQIRPGQDTLAEMLKGAGYTTAFLGKYHLAADFFKKDSNDFASESDADTSVDFSRAMENGPGDQGFDYSFTAMRGIQAGPYAFFENNLLDGDPSELITWEVGNFGDTRIIEEGIGLPSWNTRQVGPTLLAKAIEFLEAHQAAPAANPFFMYFNTEAVHDPRKPPAEIDGRPVQGTTGLGVRTDMLVEIDAIVEALLGKLEELGIAQDTLIIFTSDNGAVKNAAERTAGHHSSGGFREGKGSIYEGGHRVPLIMKWGAQAFGPSPLPQGTQIGALVGNQDVYATLAELTGTSLPDDQARDSFSMLPALMGEATVGRDHIVNEAELQESGGQDLGGKFAYRADAWKLIFNSSRSPVELYNLANDPFETTNLVSRPEQSDRVAAMRSAFEDALASPRTAPPTAPAPDFSLSPTSVAFGRQPLNVDSAAQVVTLSSTGNSALSISSIALTGSNADQFSQSHDCPPTLPRDGACEIQVRFKPTSTGSKTAFLTVAAADGAGTRQVALTGTGARSAFSVSPTSLAFGNQARGTVSAPRLVTISNTGTVVLPIASITIVGSNPGQFRQIHNCPTEVPVGGSCAASVTFNPTSRGSKSAKLRITAAGGAGVKTVGLTGNGT